MGEGELFYPSDFRMTGTDDAIKMALSRLVKEKIIERVAHGIYYKPKLHSVIGKIRPSLEKISISIANRDHVQIKPVGANALNKLGLSLQVPTKHVYITNGQPRKFKIGNAEIQFKSASPKRLALKGPISSLVILAMDELGRDAIDANLRLQIKELLNKEDMDFLKHDIRLAPAWIAKEIFTMLKEETGIKDVYEIF